MLKHAEDLKGKKNLNFHLHSCLSLLRLVGMSQYFWTASFITNVSQCPTSCYTFCIWIFLHVYTECWWLCFSKEYRLKQVLKEKTNKLNTKSRAAELWVNSSKRNNGELGLVIKSKAVRHKLECGQKLNYLVRKMVNCMDKKVQI